MHRVIRIIIFTLSMYIVTHLFVFAVLPFAILVSYVDKDRIPILKQWFVRSLFTIIGKQLTVTGYDNVDPDRAYLIISNYPSFYASFSLIGTFPRASVVVHAFVKRVPLLGQVLKRLGTIFVQPGLAGHGIKAIDLHFSQHEISTSMIILPEGGRTPDGEIHRFRRGFLHILRQSSLDLLPVTLNGMYRLKPVNRLYIDPDAELEMVIHAPVSNSAACQMSDAELLRMAHNVISGVYQP